MPIRALAKYLVMAMRQGYYVTRQHMLGKGYSLNDVHEMLACLLRHQSLIAKGE